MDKELVEQIVGLAVETALAKRDAIVMEEIDSRYHDVKLLMANYRKLKAHYALTAPESAEILSVRSVLRKTGLMMAHVDKMLVAYESICDAAQNEDERRRWKALYLRYIADERLSIDDAAAKLNIDKRTFYRDVGRALEDLAALLFGIEAIGTWKRG